MKNHNIYHVDSAIKLGDYNLRLHSRLNVHAVAAFVAFGSYSVKSLSAYCLELKIIYAAAGFFVIEAI